MRLAAVQKTTPIPLPVVALPTTATSPVAPIKQARFTPGIDSSVFNAETKPLPRSTANTPSPLWKIAYVVSSGDDKKHDIWTANADGTNKQQILADADTPCWSPNRHLLAFGRGGNVWVATADGKRQWQITFWPSDQRNEDGYPLRLYGLSWNQRERVISFGRREQYTLTLPGGKTKSLKGTTLFHASLLSGPIGTRYPFVESPAANPTDWNDEGEDGKYDHPHDLPGYDVTERRTLFGFTDNAYPSWSASGDCLAFVRNGDLWLAQKESDEKEEAEDGHATWNVDRLIPCAFYDDGVGYGDHNIDSATAISWSPDEHYLAYFLETISRGNKREVHVVHLTKSDSSDEYGTVFRLPKVHDEIVEGDSTPCFSPDGRWILTTKRVRDSEQMIAESRDGATIRTIPIQGGDAAVW